MVIVIAKIMKQGIHVGYRFLNTENKKSVFSKNADLGKQVHAIPADIRNFDHINFDLVCRDGDIDKLPVMTYHENKGNTTFTCIANDVVIVLEEIHSFEPFNEGIRGYCVTDFKGEIVDLTVEEFLSYENVGYWNAKIERRGNKTTVVPTGSKFKIGVRRSNFTVSPEAHKEVMDSVRKNFPNLKI
jgi:hypothetical protein